MSEERLGAIVESAWWLGAGWDASGQPEEEDLLLGFWWIRNRSIHDVAMLIRGYGAYEHGYGGSAPPITRQADVYADRYTPEYMQEVWASARDIERSLTEEDRTREDAKAAYVGALADRPVLDTIAEAIERLGSLAER